MIYSRRPITIAKASALLGGMIAIGLMSALVLGWSGFRELEIGGPYYQRIVDGKGLLGELLPPPEYVIEAYLEATLALKDATLKERGGKEEGASRVHDDHSLDLRIARLKRLHTDFNQREDYWSHRPLSARLRRELLEDSHVQAVAFWQALESELLPALRAGNTDAAQSAYAHVQQAYEAQRLVIEGMIVELGRVNAINELNALNREEVLSFWIGLAFLSVIILVMVAAHLARSRVVQPIEHLTSAMRRLGKGDQHLDIPCLERGDELGHIAKELAVLKQGIRERTQLAEENDRFSEVLAHHFQEPVRLQQVYADLLKTQLVNPSAEVMVSLGRIMDGARRLRALLSDVQTYVTLRVQPIPENACDTNLAFDSALASFRSQLAAIGGTVVRGELEPVAMDPNRVIHVFSLLIENAIKYRRPDRTLYVQVDWFANDNGVGVTFTDNGIGIAPEFRQRVFQVFERLHSDPDIPGTGIGLALVKKIVVLSQGTVWIEAGDAGGCRVCMVLPMPKAAEKKERK